MSVWMHKLCVTNITLLSWVFHLHADIVWFNLASAKDLSKAHCYCFCFVCFLFLFICFLFEEKRREEKRYDDLSHYCWQWRHPSQSNSLQLGTNSLLVSQAYHRHISFQCLISVFCIFLLWNTAVYCWVLDRREDKRTLKKLRMTNECYVCYSSQTQTILVSDNFIH